MTWGSRLMRFQGRSGARNEKISVIGSSHLSKLVSCPINNFTYGFSCDRVNKIRNRRALWRDNPSRMCLDTRVARPIDCDGSIPFLAARPHPAGTHRADGRRRHDQQRDLHRRGTFPSIGHQVAQTLHRPGPHGPLRGVAAGSAAHHRRRSDRPADPANPRDPA